MIRSCVKRSFYYCAFWPLSGFGDDVVTGKTETERKAQDEIKNSAETGWERVKRIFQKDDFGLLSSELTSITQVTWLSIFVGAIYGGINNSKEAYIDFIKNNQATAFKSHFEAKKLLQEKITMSFAKGALKWSWRVSLFSTTFVGTYTIIQTYRNKCGIIEYVAAGVTSGVIYKFNMGPRGWVVGAGVGAVLGLLGGGLTNLLLGLTGMTMEEARYWQNHWQRERSRYIHRTAEEHRQKEENVLLYEYSKAHENLGLNLENVDSESQKK